MRSFKPALAAAFMLTSAFAGFPSAAHAVTTDGDWRVVIITEKGSCDRAYSYNVNISHGHVNYRGSAPIQLAGTVTPSGAVKVNISAGKKGASGSGHLSANEGVGTWRGSGSGAECAGRWEARRL